MVKLHELGFELLPHLPYTPNLAPSDFFSLERGCSLNRNFAPMKTSNGREHALVAEDHESMMLWILALQARQDKPIPEPSTEASTSSKRKQQQPSSHTSNNAQPNLHTVAASVKNKVLQRTHSLQLHPERRHDALRRMHSLWTTTSHDTDPIPNGKGHWLVHLVDVLQRDCLPCMFQLTSYINAIKEGSEMSNQNHNVKKLSVRCLNPSPDVSCNLADNNIDRVDNIELTLVFLRDRLSYTFQLAS
ncbi:PH domain-containing protein [Trichonephila clavipes]|nr:PH domain-containing protein [Trichonephila clavipes]